MIWFLVVAGILLILLGVWGGPRRRHRPDKASRIPREATVQEAWDILTSPVEYEEELIKIPEHKPWFIPGADRRFQRGLLVGLGLGLMLAAMVAPFVSLGKAPTSQTPEESPAQTGKQPDTAQQPVVESPPPPPVTPPAPPPTPANITFVVEPGATSHEIAANLKQAGLIKQEQEFLDLVVAYGVETQLKAGTFVIPSDASVDAVLKMLTE